MLKNNQNERILMNFSEDGIGDIVIGLALMLGAMAIYFDLIPFAGISVILLVPVMLSFKRTYIAPRISLDDFPPDIGRTVQRNQVLLFGILTFALLFGIVVL